MNTSPSTPAAPAPTAVQIVLAILDALLRAIGERGRATSWATRVLPAERIMLADARVRKFRRAFKALAGKILDGTLRERPYAPRGPRAAPAIPYDREKLRLPRGKWWLCAWVPMRAAGCGSQLSWLLRHNEEMQELVASERMYRLIRPVCKALAVDPNELAKAAVRGVALWEAADAARAAEGEVAMDAAAGIETSPAVTPRPLSTENTASIDPFPSCSACRGAAAQDLDWEDARPSPDARGEGNTDNCSK